MCLMCFAKNFFPNSKVSKSSSQCFRMILFNDAMKTVVKDASRLDEYVFKRGYFRAPAAFRLRDNSEFEIKRAIST